MGNSQVVLVTGASGYVGGQLVPRLLEEGYRVRVLARDRTRLQGRPWIRQVDVAQGDVLRPDTLPRAMADVMVAYYLVHSMSGARDFHKRDLVAAQNFGQASAAAGIQRIIYLGGLGDPQTDLSRHLRSRQQTAAVLRESGVAVTEFRAAVIVGSGGVSFEMIRHLTERLPVMVCPRWVYTRIQPIAVRDVLSYLVAALRVPDSAGQTIEIGGASVIAYADMIMGYARARGLHRILIHVPVLTPKLSSYWVHWVTPIPASIAQPLIEGLRNEVVVRDDRARTLFPEIRPMDYKNALRLALDDLNTGQVGATWDDALAASQGNVPPVTLTSGQGFIVERRQELVAAAPADVYDVFISLGGRRGWLYANWAWALRGFLDGMIGGVGLRRRRRQPHELQVGDALDSWRVEAIEPKRLLRLRAEVKVPGRSWLQFEAHPEADNRARLVQTAFFAPKGLWGLVYWYGLYPLHAKIFSGLIREIARRAEASSLGESQGRYSSSGP